MSSWRDGVNWVVERIRDSMPWVWSMASQAIGKERFSTQWPPPGDKERLARYSTFRRLYEGDHETVYVTDGRYSYDQERDYVTVNVCGEITDLLVDRLFGETLQISGPADDDDAAEWLAHLHAANDFANLWVDLGTGTSYRGDGALEIYYDGEQQDVRMRAISPSIVFVETVNDDTDRIARIIIGYIRWNDAKAYLYQEIHEPGLISYRLYELHGDLRGNYGYTPERDRQPLDTIEDLADLPDEEETGIDEMLIVPIGLGGHDESGIWGRSDYADVMNLQGELNNRATQSAEVLDKHGDPWMYGPDLFLDEEQRLDPQHRYLSVDNQEQVPGYLTWDGELGPAETEIQRIINHMLFTAGLSPESFGMDDGGGAESGRALKLRQHRTASAVRMRHRVYGTAIRRGISVASKLANSTAVGPVWDGRVPPVLEPQDIALGWQDGLPDDETQQIEQAGMEVSYQILSRRTAIEQRHPDWDEDRVQEELDRIAEDRGTVPAPGGTGRLGLNSGLENVEEEGGTA
ncbi:MAG: phage portal protein [Armatimonadota bacterium]